MFYEQWIYAIFVIHGQFNKYIVGFNELITTISYSINKIMVDILEIHEQNVTH